VARVIFVNGFNRSGTTLVTAAVTEATHGTTLTVGHLARHLPGVDRFLKTSRKRATAPDRGVDRLPVNESTPEEYGWLLHAKTGEFAFGAEAAESGVLRNMVDELAAERDATVILKNPWDTGREQLLLDHLEGAQVLLVRRELRAIEDSVGRAMERIATSSGYTRALLSDRRRAAEFMAQILNPQARQEMIRETQQKIRRDAVRLAGGVSELPLDRIALLSYDELRDDPKAGAAWAAHLIDPDAFGRAVAALSFPEYNRARHDSREIDEVDRQWAEAWERARAEQIKAGILSPPIPPPEA
jgi:sulfotransferase family protein